MRGNEGLSPENIKQAINDAFPDIDDININDDDILTFTLYGITFEFDPFYEEDIADLIMTGIDNPYGIDIKELPDDFGDYINDIYRSLCEWYDITP